jgi:hypothetical protein
MTTTPLRNFDDVTTAPQIDVKSSVGFSAEVTVTVNPSTSSSFLLRSDEAWDWQDLRDYVVREIEARFGVFPRNPLREAATFKSFMTRWGVQAPAIARYAFETLDGRWAGAPISVNRFCKNSDPYFAAVIAETITR